MGFHGLTPSPEIKTLIHDYHVGGIVLFSRNFENAEQLQVGFGENDQHSSLMFTTGLDT